MFDDTVCDELIKIVSGQFQEINEDAPRMFAKARHGRDERVGAAQSECIPDHDGLRNGTAHSTQHAPRVNVFILKNFVRREAWSGRHPGVRQSSNSFSLG